MDINFIRGDSVVLTFRINDDAGNLIQMEDIETLDLTARRFASDKSTALFCKSKNDFSIVDNQYLVNLEPEDTEQLSCTEFSFDIEITLKDGTRKTKICRVDMQKDYTIRKNNQETGVKIIYPDLEDITITPSLEEQNLKSSKDGFNNIKVLGEENLLPENIKQGVSIYGVEGIILEAGEENATMKNPGNKTSFTLAQWLSEIKLVDFNGVTNAGEAFFYCEQLKKIGTTINTSGLTDIHSMFSGCTLLEEAPEMDTSKVAIINDAFGYCSSLKKLPQYNTSNVTNMGLMCRYCSALTEVPELNAEKVTNISTAFTGCTALENFGGLLNLGKGYTQKSKSYSNYTLNLSTCKNLIHDSLMNIINKLYDLNLTYDVANGGTLYRQSLVIGSTNLAKLTADEIAVATNKGWDVS